MSNGRKLSEWSDKVVQLLTIFDALPAIAFAVGDTVVDRDNSIEMQDLKQINSMTFSFEWMTTGRQPGTYRGIDENAVYQRRSYENIDLIPDIEMQLREENDINKKHLFMTIEEKVIP